jgi:cytochrome P450
MSDLSGLSFTRPEIQTCPFPAYERLREEAPVFVDPVSGHYIVTRYDDVRKALLNVAQLSNISGLIAPSRKSARQDEVDAVYREKGWMPTETLVTNDPPSHRFYRALVDRVFTYHRVVSMEPYIQQIIDELTLSFAADGEVEFVSRFAVLLPMYVIADQLGVSRDDIALFKHWSDVSIEIASPTSTPEADIEFAHMVTEMQQYFMRVIDGFRTDPRDCMLSNLVNVEVDGRSLDTRELMSIVHNLLVGGNETTTNALGSGMLILAQDPILQDRLRADPEQIPAFVEEVLRLRSPIQGLARKALSDVTIAGVTIPKDAIVILRFGAANRDPRMFADPDTLMIERSNAKAHMAFGSGIHTCIGNLLARTELRMAYGTLLRRFRNLRLADGAASFEQVPTYIAYGLCRLDLRFDEIRS